MKNEMLIYQVFRKEKELSREIPELDYYVVSKATLVNSKETLVKYEWPDAKKALANGKEVIGIANTAFYLPFFLEDVPYGKDQKVTVSGSIHLRINPNNAFRDYLASHHGIDQLQLMELIVEFNEGENGLSLVSVLRHLLSSSPELCTATSHGERALEADELRNTLPSCWGIQVNERTETPTPDVRFVIDRPGEASQFTDQVIKAYESCQKKKEEDQKKEEEKRNKMPFLQSIWQFLEKGNKKLRWLSGTLLVLLVSAWGRELLLSHLGIGSAFGVHCKVSFVGDSDAGLFERANLEKELNAYFHEQVFQGVDYASFRYDTDYVFTGGVFKDGGDAQKLVDWLTHYVQNRSGILLAQVDDHRRVGIRKILKFGANYLNYTVRLANGEATEYTLGLQSRDPSHRVAALMKALFNKDETNTYRLSIFPAQLSRLQNVLEQDEELQQLGLQMTYNGNAIVLKFTNPQQEYQLDLENLCAFPNQVETVKTALSDHKIMLDNNMRGTVLLRDSECRELQEIVQKEGLVILPLEHTADNESWLARFDLSQEFRLKNGIRYAWSTQADEIKKWWTTEAEQYAKITETMENLEREALSFSVPNPMTDEAYKAAQQKLTSLKQSLEATTAAASQLLAQINYYGKGNLTAEGRTAAEQAYRLKKWTAPEAVEERVQRVNDALGLVASNHKKMLEEQAIGQKLQEWTSHTKEAQLELAAAEKRFTTLDGNDLAIFAELCQDNERVERKFLATIQENFVWNGETLKLDVATPRQAQEVVANGWQKLHQQTGAKQKEQAIGQKLQEWTSHTKEAQLELAAAEKRFTTLDGNDLAIFAELCQDNERVERKFLATIQENFVWNGETLKLDVATPRQAQEVVANGWQKLHQQTGAKQAALIKEAVQKDFLKNQADFERDVARLQTLRQKIAEMIEAMANAERESEPLRWLPEDIVKNKVALKAFMQRVEDKLREDKLLEKDNLDFLEKFLTTWNETAYSQKLGDAVLQKHSDLLEELVKAQRAGLVAKFGGKKKTEQASLQELQEQARQVQNELQTGLQGRLKKLRKTLHLD